MPEKTTPHKPADVKSVLALVDQYKPAMRELLPRHLSVDKMFQTARLAFQRNPRILECTPASLIGSLMQCSQLGLFPDGLTGKAYLVPYWNSKVGRYVCEIIPGYQGLMDLARRSQHVNRFDAHEVYRDDEWEYSYGLTPTLRHRPLTAGQHRTNENVIACYALAYEDGEPRFYVADRDEILAARKRSKSANDGPWVTDFVPMGKKTAVRRFVKFLPNQTELSMAVALDELAETDQSQGVELAFVPELIGVGEGEIEKHAEERAAQPRAGGPFPSDVLQAGLAKGWTQAEAQEFACRHVNKEFEDIAKGAECAAILKAIAEAPVKEPVAAGK